MVVTLDMRLNDNDIIDFDVIRSKSWHRGVVITIDQLSVVNHLERDRLGRY